MIRVTEDKQLGLTILNQTAAMKLRGLAVFVPDTKGPPLERTIEHFDHLGPGEDTSGFVTGPGPGTYDLLFRDTKNTCYLFKKLEFTKGKTTTVTFEESVLREKTLDCNVYDDEATKNGWGVAVSADGTPEDDDNVPRDKQTVAQGAACKSTSQCEKGNVCAKVCVRKGRHQGHSCHTSADCRGDLHCELPTNKRCGFKDPEKCRECRP